MGMHEISRTRRDSSVMRSNEEDGSVSAQEPAMMETNLQPLEVLPYGANARSGRDLGKVLTSINRYGNRRRRPVEIMIADAHFAQTLWIT